MLPYFENAHIKNDDEMQKNLGQKGMQESDVAENESAETVYLARKSKNSSIRAWLIPSDIFGGESISLTKDIYLVGKKMAGADIALDSTAVSRIHARFIWENDNYKLMDLGARNGTFINDKEMEPGKTETLKEGDEVTFGDVSFRYCITETF